MCVRERDEGRREGIFGLTSRDPPPPPAAAVPPPPIAGRCEGEIADPLLLDRGGEMEDVAVLPDFEPLELEPEPEEGEGDEAAAPGVVDGVEEEEDDEEEEEEEEERESI